MNTRSILSVAQSVLTGTVFADAVELKEAPQDTSMRFLAADVAYQGGANGRILFIAPSSLCAEWSDLMCSNDTAETLFDVLGEVANVISGNWITQAFPEEARVALAPPTVRECSSSFFFETLGSPSTIALSVEGQPFLVEVQPDGGST